MKAEREAWALAVKRTAGLLIRRGLGEPRRQIARPAWGQVLLLLGTGKQCRE